MLSGLHDLCSWGGCEYEGVAASLVLGATRRRHGWRSVFALCYSGRQCLISGGNSGCL